MEIFDSNNPNRPIMDTPMTRKWKSLKNKHPEAVVLLRIGSFYETYFNDAQDISEILGVTLTTRNSKGYEGKDTRMAGFPCHTIDIYLPKLVRAGKRVVISD